MRNGFFLSVVISVGLVSAAQAGVTVVGGKKCSTGLSDTDHRTAVVRKQPMKGMTPREIESMFGRPSEVTRTGNETIYRWWKNRNKEYASVTFNSSGCATRVYSSVTN